MYYMSGIISSKYGVSSITRLYFDAWNGIYLKRIKIKLVSQQNEQQNNYKIYAS